MIDISYVRPKSLMIIGRTVFFVTSTFNSKKCSTFAENKDNSKF